MIFYNKNDRLQSVKIKKNELEKTLQKLVEKNLDVLFHLNFLATEFSLGKFRCDSIAYDKENNSFVIIEYKRGKNESLVDQGYAYLHTVLDRKADIVLLYNEVMRASKSARDFDWTATRIYFVSPQFTEYQKVATGYQKMPFRLFEVNQYVNGVVTVDEIKEDKLKEEPIVLSENDNIKKVNREIVVYTEEDHCDKATENIREIYNILKERIMDLGNIHVEPKKVYIAFKNNSNNICDVEIFKNSLKIFINVKEGILNDPLGRARKIRHIGHHGNGDYDVTLNSGEDIDYLMTLIGQSYKINSEIE